MDKLSDIELILLLKKSNKKAFAELYLRYYYQLVDYGVRLSNDRFIAEESISELFLYIYEARDRLGIIKIVKSYLYSSYRRLLIRKIIASRKSSSTAIDTNIGDKQIYYSASDLSIDQYGELQKRKALAKAAIPQKELATKAKKINKAPLPLRRSRSCCNFVYIPITKLRGSVCLCASESTFYPGNSELLSFPSFANQGTKKLFIRRSWFENIGEE